MNWLTFALMAWVFFGMELGLKGGLRIGPEVAPSFVLGYAVFIGLLAAPRTALWAFFVLGLLMDLTAKVGLTGVDRSVALVGPYTLGYLLAGQLVLTMRGLMIRRNPLTMGVLAWLASMVANIVVVALYSLRELMGDPVAIHATKELVQRFGASVYTALLAVVLALVLIPMAPAFGLQSPHARRFARQST